MRIQVSRDKGYYGRWSKLKLYVDDEHLFDIKAGEQIKIEEPSAQIDGRRSVASILRSVFLPPELPEGYLNMKSLPMRLSRDDEEETTSYLGNR